MQINLYALRLEKDHYYIGQATNTKARFEAHRLGMGAAWTLAYAPLEIVHDEQLELNDLRQAACRENWLTLRYMEKYGWQNVRGGEFLAIDEEKLKEQLHGIYDTGLNQIRYHLSDCLYLFGPSSEWLIYVLKLQNDCFYIGSTKRLGKALGQHFNGTGISWTINNPPLEVVELLVVGEGDGHYLEIKQKMLASYIERYGRDHVIGGNEI